jgi:hypothetical protein
MKATRFQREICFGAYGILKKGLPDPIWQPNGPLVIPALTAEQEIATSCQ